MARTDDSQLNIRSRYARDRAAQLVQSTGMTATQIIEEALRAYSPPMSALPGKLVRHGAILVRPGGNRVTLEEANAALDASREERT
jgi:hypothetical protein